MTDSLKSFKVTNSQISFKVTNSQTSFKATNSQKSFIVTNSQKSIFGQKSTYDKKTKKLSLKKRKFVQYFLVKNNQNQFIFLSENRFFPNENLVQVKLFDQN